MSFNKTIISLREMLPTTANSEKIFIQKGEVISRTHSRISHIYYLVRGELEYYLTDEITDEETKLFCTKQKGMIIGWETLNPPERFISNIRVKSKNAVCYKISKEDFIDDLKPSSLIDICQKLHHLLETSFYKQTELLSVKVRQRAVKLENYFIPQESTLEERKVLLRRSPFFGEFKEHEITSLARLLERREYEANELIYEQDNYTTGVFILIQGEVSIRRQEGERYLNLRSVSTPGYIFGWSSTFGDTDICRASTEHKTSVYFIDTKRLMPLISEIEFGIDFFKMVVWLIGNQLQLSQSQYLYLLDDHNLISVKHLIDINRPRIPLPSPLHQIPHLIKDSSTKTLAFSTLHRLHKNGTKQERHLSSICLDLLKGEEREMLFLESIAEVYKVVSGGSPKNAEQNRKKCAEKTYRVFEQVSFHLEGTENLPKDSGNIFIYNHLLNHPHYILNNKFQLTLDSHFISAMILYKQYNDPGIRTVRFGKSSEYGHQDYYENLGYINVYTRDSDLQNEESRDQAKELFYKEAEDHLRSGTNIIISPEGTSFLTEESPGPFKMGPFNLATKATKEPYLVPIVFCNFDKRIVENLFFCRILKPFKISEKKKEGQLLKDFVEKYQEEFSTEVNIARIKAEGLLKELNH
ncbi:MAG: cyclic nucleotide-binding domain-containing protein [Bacteroidota bacterium]